MAKLSKAELQTIVASYVDGSKIAVDSFSATYNNTVGLLDKVAKSFTLDSIYTDKLGMFDGEDLEFGKILEEWKSDLILPADYDSTGANTLAPHVSTYRPVSYSFTLGRKQIPQTIRNNDIERAVKNGDELAKIIADKYKAMTDSEVVFKYGLKRQALATLIARCVAAMASTTSGVITFAKATAMPNVNSLVIKSGTTAVYTLVKAYPANGASDFEDAVAKGYLIENKLTQVIAVPEDETTGEAFITQLKKDVEIAEDISEGHSLNANTLGASPEGLVLVVKQGVMPEIEAKVMAGAFHMDQVAVPAKVVRVPDFGGDTNKCYAMLMDARGMRLFNSYRAVRENLNGEGDFLNLFYHTENTVHISRNTFIKCYLDD